MTINYSQLKTEIQTDPAALGYAPFIASGSDNAIADLLNAVGAFSINRTRIPAVEVVNAIVPTEWTALTADEKNRISFIVSAGEVDASAANTRSAFLAAFAGGTTTRANLVALQTRPGSRAEALFGSGTFVSADDVAKALRAT